MTKDDARHDQLTTAPAATEADAAPRVDVDTSEPGVRRIEWRDDAPIRPGAPDAPRTTETTDQEDGRR